MRLRTEAYTEQLKIWPKSGRHILAHYDERSIIVYQAYCPAIAGYAIEHGQFGGPEFNYSRMSWIKPGFLWMMCRSGWCTKVNQEVILALRLRREFFDSLLAQAVPTQSGMLSTDPARKQRDAVADYTDCTDGKDPIGEGHSGERHPAVRVQWDPDHDPAGRSLSRRAIQLGLRGQVLEAYGQRELLEVIDLSAFVAEQRDRLRAEGTAALETPCERVYVPADPAVAARVGL